jgi:hypothetical protein
MDDKTLEEKARQYLNQEENEVKELIHNRN